jgi:sarcosine oxidase subunit beta
LFKRPPDFGGDHPVIGDVPNSVYCRPFGRGITLVGSYLLDPKSSDPDAFNMSVDWDEVEHMSQAMMKRFRGLDRAVFFSGFTYLYDITPDHHPILDEVGPDGFYCAVGFSGHGFKESPVIGEMMADLIVDGNKARSDINFFRFSRFDEGRPIPIGFGMA